MDLYTIKYSNYNEKARWALALSQTAYREHAYLPFLHMLPILWLTKGKGTADKTSSPLSTPVLKKPDGELVLSSSAILQSVSSSQVDLYWHPDAAELETQLDNSLGVESRRLAYYYLLFRRDLIRQMAFNNVGKVQASLYCLFQIPFEKLFVKLFHLTPERINKSKEKIECVLQEVESRLKDGRPYLCGDKISAADIAFACHMAPLLVLQAEEGYGAWFPAIADCPADLAKLANSMRQRPAGKFALRLFQEKMRLNNSHV